jgi:PEP-CTERM motif
MFLEEFEMYFPRAAALMVAALLPIAATIAPASAAVTENFDFTLTGVAEDAAGLGAGLSGSGEVTGTLESNGSVLVTAITGTVDGSMIKKVVKVDGFLGNDNLIFPTATSPAGTPLVDGQGFAFKLANGQDVQVFGDDLPAGIFEIEGTNSNGAAEFTLTAAVPEPSTWAMMILGFCGLGFMAYRRKQNGAALSVA